MRDSIVNSIEEKLKMIIESVMPQPNRTYPLVYVNRKNSNRRLEL